MATSSMLNNIITDDDTWLKQFEAKLRLVDRVAIFTNAAYALGSVIRNCQFSVALTIIFINTVHNLKSDQRIHNVCDTVVTLILLELIRASSARFFGFFVLQKLTMTTTDPIFLTYSDSTRQSLIWFSRKVHSGIQILILAFSIVLSIDGLCFQSPTKNSVSEHGEFLLRIFYLFTLSSSILATLAMAVVESFLVPLVVNSSGLRKYYDTRIWMGMEKGFFHACFDAVDFLSFCFNVQVDEYRRNLRAPVVMELYGDLMRYLYCEARFKGFEKAAQLLESGDPHEREAAANIVGCWMRIMEENKSSKWKTLMLQRSLLSKLADALDHDETGRAATSSFEALAKKDAKFTAMVKNQKGEKVADVLMDRIHEVVEMGKSDKSIVFIKVWIHLLPVVLSLNNTKENQYNINEDKIISNGPASFWQAVIENMKDQSLSKYCSIGKLLVLQQDLAKIVSDAGALKRTQAVSAYALLISDDPLLKSMLPSLRENLLIPPKRVEHILTEERDYALCVLNLNHSKCVDDGYDVSLPSEWDSKVKHRAISPLQKVLKKQLSIRVHVSGYVSSLITLAVPILSSLCFTAFHHTHMANA